MELRVDEFEGFLKVLRDRQNRAIEATLARDEGHEEHLRVHREYCRKRAAEAKTGVEFMMWMEEDWPVAIDRSPNARWPVYELGPDGSLRRTYVCPIGGSATIPKPSISPCASPDHEYWSDRGGCPECRKAKGAF